jgi:fumarylacetoacetase
MKSTHLGYGVFDDGRGARVGVRRGDGVLDVAPLAADAGLAEAEALAADTLNPFMALGRASWLRVGDWLAGLDAPTIPLDEVRLLLPFAVADYVDFYSSLHHAENVGRILRPDAEPLVPSWRHLPAGYHGRSGTVVVSGTPISRPHGQRVVAGESTPSFGPTLRLDVEVEVGFVVGVPSALGAPIPVDAFADHVFGLCLVNDWSARDIQAFEYVPLGPFLGKSFATSISPWIIPLHALDAARVPPPPQDPPPAEHLRAAEPWGYDLHLELDINGTVVSRPPFSSMYWTPAQQLAHLTSNGASARTGDLYASGTVSGPQREQWGSLLELGQGDAAAFLADGDVVAIRGSGAGQDLGEVTGRIVGD